MKIVTFLRINADPAKRVVDFPRERDTFRNKIEEIVEDFACETKFLHFPLFIIFRHYSLFFPFFHVFHFSFFHIFIFHILSFFHFPSLFFFFFFLFFSFPFPLPFPTSFSFFFSFALVLKICTVSSVVGAPWRCGVLTTKGGIAGIGLDRLLG